MYKYLIAVVAALGVIYGIYHFGYTQGVASVNLKDSKTTEVQTGKARISEQGAVAQQSAQDLNYQKGALDAKKSTQILVDSLLNGGSGMFIPTEVQPAATVSSPAAPVSKCNAAPAAQLPRKTAADLANLLGEADDVVRQLQRCQTEVVNQKQTIDDFNKSLK